MKYPGPTAGCITQCLMAPEEVETLALLASLLPLGSQIVEIGSFEGMSTVALANGAKVSRSHVMSIDWGQGSPSEDMWAATGDYVLRYEHNLREFGVEDYVTTIREDSRIVGAQWQRGPIHFLFVDGEHTREACLADSLAFRPHLAQGAVVAFHDFCPSFMGVMQAVPQAFPFWWERRVAQVNTLLALRHIT